MSTKIDLRDIFTDHFKTLYDASTGKLSAIDIGVFIVIPLVSGAINFLLKITISLTAVGILVSALSVLAGFLINVLVLLYTVKEVGPSQTEIDDQKNLIKEVNANLLFSITLSIISILLLCGIRVFPDFTHLYFSSIIVIILANFLLTLLMALKRLKLLLNLRFK
jgi:hypothetical protein